jgi:hypothetical protein
MTDDCIAAINRQAALSVCAKLSGPPLLESRASGILGRGSSRADTVGADAEQ